MTWPRRIPLAQQLLVAKKKYELNLSVIGRNTFFILCYLFLLISVCVCVFKWGWGGFSGIFVVLLGLVKLHLYGLESYFLKA